MHTVEPVEECRQFALLSIFCFMPAFSSQATDKDLLVYIGTYTGARSKGIYVSHFDARAGKLTSPELAAERKTQASWPSTRINRSFIAWVSG